MMSGVTPGGAFSCQSRHITRHIPGFILILGLLLGGCASDDTPAPAAEKPPPEIHLPPPQPPTVLLDDPRVLPEIKPIETRRLHLAEPKVERRIQEAPTLAGLVEVRTWSDERIRGRVVAENEDDYVIDTATGTSEPRIRRVPRAAVMALTVLGP